MNSVARAKFFSGSGPQRIWRSATFVLFLPAIAKDYR
jgi:hypothetical protein